MIITEREEQSSQQDKLATFRQLIKDLNRENSLFISRVDNKTKNEFKNWAYEDFAGDYGMALKWLWDMRKGSMLPEGAEINAWMQDFNARLEALEYGSSQPEESKKREIRLGNGKTIEVNRDE